jgi:hypothetical protein
MMEEAVTNLCDTTTPTESEQLQKAMEYLIDRYSALGVIIAFGEACQMKSDKLAKDWQNVPESEMWQSLAEQVFCLECDGI